MNVNIHIGHAEVPPKALPFLTWIILGKEWMALFEASSAR
jgi:hypothetical protein